MIEKLEIKANEKILIIAPHPDDECIGVGGLLAMYSEQCYILVCTDGSCAQGGADRQSMRECRKKEFIDEMGYLGIGQYKFLDITDGTLMQNLNFLDDLNISQFDKIFVTHDGEGHPDHSAACIGVMRYLQRADARPELYLYEIHKQMGAVTHYLDISDCIKEKLRLIQFHKSQLKNFEWDNLMRLNAEYRAIQLGSKKKYIEAYYKASLKDTLEYGNLLNREFEIRYQKQLEFYRVLIMWNMKLLEKKYITQYLYEKGFENIAIYGYAELGELLYLESKKTDIKVLYAMDKGKCGGNYRELSIYYPCKGLTKVDAVVVTAIYYFDQIKEELEKLGYTNIFSLRRLVDAY